MAPRARMNSSTSASMSSVDMPGFTLVRRRSITSERMWPPRRMSPISRGDLSSIIGRSAGLRGGAPDGGRDRLHAALGLDARQQPAPPVVLQQRRGLPRVDVQAVAHGGFAVV